MVLQQMNDVSKKMAMTAIIPYTEYSKSNLVHIILELFVIYIPVKYNIVYNKKLIKMPIELRIIISNNTIMNM